MRFGSLFDGIYGFGLGLERAGMKCTWRAEIDKNCDELMKVRRPNIPNLGDVRNVGKHNAEPVDLVCGGFPCQDLSIAGKRAGLAGERSGLWHEFHRIVAEIKPRWVVVENVPGLLSSNGGRDFAIILRGLVECGYGVAWRILDAQYFGVAQRRRRVFIVASLGSGRCAEVLFESEGVSGDSAESRTTGESIAGTLGARTKAGGFPGTDEALDGYIQVSGTLSANRGGLDRPAGNANELDFCIPCAQPLRSGRQFSDMGDGQSNIVPVAFDWQNGGTSKRTQIVRTGGEYAKLKSSSVDAVLGDGRLDGVRRLTPTECERLQGFPDGWTDGFSDSARYKMLGNAVAVPCAEWLGRRILQNGILLDDTLRQEI